MLAAPSPVSCRYEKAVTRRLLVSRHNLAKLAASAASEASSKLRGAMARSRQSSFTDRVAPWLRQRLGHQITRALRDALSRALKAAPEEPAEPDED